MNNPLVKQTEEVLGSKIVSTSEALQGMDSEVFFATTEKGQQLVVKYGYSVLSDIAAYQLLSANKVEIAVPKMLGTFVWDEKPGLILEKIHFPLLENIDNKEIGKYVPSMIANLKKIHTIKSKTAGNLTDDYRTGTWKEILLARFNDTNLSFSWQEISQRDGLDSELVVKSVAKIIKQIITTDCPEAPYTLIHTDFNQRNLFVNPEKTEIAAIIDWGEALFGDPIMDFARVRMLLWHFGIDTKEYYEIMNFSENEQQRENLYFNYRVLEYLAYYSEDLTPFNVGRIKLHQTYLAKL